VIFHIYKSSSDEKIARKRKAMNEISFVSADFAGASVRK
jgi:hypothetical protein